MSRQKIASAPTRTPWEAAMKQQGSRANCRRTHLSQLRRDLESRREYCQHDIWVKNRALKMEKSHQPVISTIWNWCQDFSPFRWCRESLGFRFLVKGLGNFRVKGLGFGVWGLDWGFRVWVQGLNKFIEVSRDFSQIKSINYYWLNKVNKLGYFKGFSFSISQ